MPTPLRKRQQRGVTLIEIMITVSLMVLLAAAVASAFVAGLDTERRQVRLRSERNQTKAMEGRITALLQGARLSEDTQDRTTYFIGNDASITMTPLPTTPTAGATSGSATTPPTLTGNGNDNNDLGATRVIFTTIAPNIPIRARNDSDDFETQYRKQGAIGGMAEVAYTMTPVGEVGDKSGLFERMQRPSDGDPGQGGMESLRNADVSKIGFQFWNGSSWVTTWDTTTGVRRLPAAVQVSYILKTDQSGVIRRFVVPIPASDVTTQNPVANATGGTP